MGQYQQTGIVHVAALFTQQGKVAVDIGAHIGHFTWVLQQYFDVVAFECNHSNFQCLVSNINARKQQMLHNITVHKQALLDKKTPVVITNPDERNSGGSFVIEDTEGEHIAVPLDDYQLQDVGLIKIDVQGSDLLVLKGATRTLEQKPNLLLEMVNNDVYEQELSEYLIGIGYQQAITCGKQELWSKSGKIST